LIHDLVIDNRYRSVEQIAVALWGSANSANKAKNLYRKLNPNDPGASLRPEELVGLMIILDGACESDDERDRLGGAAIVHHLAAKAGMVAARRAGPGEGGGRTATGSLRALGECTVKILEYLDEPGSPAALEGVLAESYKVHSALLRLESILRPAPKMLGRTG
jgi:hypothetical protein